MSALVAFALGVLSGGAIAGPVVAIVMGAVRAGRREDEQAQRDGAALTVLHDGPDHLYTTGAPLTSEEVQRLRAALAAPPSQRGPVCIVCRLDGRAACPEHGGTPGGAR